MPKPKTELERANKAENLFSSVSEGLNFEKTLAERFDFLKEYVSKPFEEKYKLNRENKPLEDRIERYEEKLRELNIEPENLSLTRTFFLVCFPVFFLAALFDFAFFAAFAHRRDSAFSGLSALPIS